MATLNEIAKLIVEDYNKKFSTTSIVDIAKRINSLTYSDNNRPLSNADKEKLLEIIQFKLQYGVDKNLGDSVFRGESEDSSNFIDLVKAIKDLVIKK